jgi:HEPN domain-containing protein
MSDAEFLKKRAVEFWERAKEDFKKGSYNLTALDVEQALQLWVKYLIF